MYIGKTPTVGNFQVCDAISVVNGQAAYTLQVGGVNVAPESANHMLVSLNGILQKPGSSFTISGSTMTFASNLATGDVIDFVQILGNVLDLGVPSDDTVTAAKIVDDAVSDEHLDVTAITGQTAETSAADADTIIIHDDSASALRKMTRSNFLSGVGGNNTPLFRAGPQNSGLQSISNNTYTKVSFSNEIYDPSGVYDASSNYRFTPGTAGYYLISALVMYEDARSQTDSRCFQTAVIRRHFREINLSFGAFRSIAIQVFLMLAHFSVLRRIFSIFGRISSYLAFVSRFFEILHRFCMDFGRIWEGFWEDSSKIFGVFLENADFVKNCVFLKENCYF